MPPKIKLHVSTNNRIDGILSVKVTPWRVHLDKSDTATWELDAAGGAKNDILWFRVEQTDPLHPWPFQPPTPPDSRYTGTGAGATVTSTPKDNAANKVGDVIAYGLTIAFRDDDGKTRTMVIDPDMVIDS